MLVLRFTIGQATEEVRTARTDLVVGSDPSADVHLALGGVAPRALRLTRQESEVHLEALGSGRRLTLRVGDAVEVDGLGVALVGLLPQEHASQPAPQFGGYEDDVLLPGPRSFELAPETPAPAVLPPPPARPTAPAARAASPRPTPAAASPAAPFRATPSQAGVSRAAPRETVAPKPDAAPAAAASTLTPEQRAALLRRLRFPDGTFGEQLTAQLKRSPFFAISIGVHLLIFLLLMLLDTTSSQPPLRKGPGAVTASMDAQDDELGREVPELEDDGLPLDEMKLPDLPELELEHDSPETDQPTPPTTLPQLDEESVPRPLEIGVMPGLHAASQRLRKRAPKMPKVDLRETFNKGTAGSSTERSAEIIRAALGRGRGGNGASLEDLRSEDILVVSGSFDHIGRVLDALRLKYVQKAPWSITAPTPEDFRNYKIVFWNCGESLGRKRMEDVGKRLREFVRNGGYLFTTDWGVSNVLPYAFPGYLKTNGNRAHLPEMVLPIEPARSARDHPLLEGVFHESTQGKWWLEQASFDIAVGRPDAVTVLIESPMLAATFNRSPAVAVTFNYGRGRVLHAMGHYYQEAGNLAGTISAHRLALNFVLMRLDQDRPAR